MALARTCFMRPWPGRVVSTMVTRPARSSASRSRLTALRSRCSRVAMSVMEPGACRTARNNARRAALIKLHHLRRVFEAQDALSCQPLAPINSARQLAPALKERLFGAGGDRELAHVQSFKPSQSCSRRCSPLRMVSMQTWMRRENSSCDLPGFSEPFIPVRRPGWHLPQVDRLFDLPHASRFDQLEAAARALGRHIEVRVSS